jgi:hypothetical protein
MGDDCCCVSNPQRNGRLVEMHGTEPADIREAFETGEISADELKAISTGLEKLASIESIEDLRNRLSELEASAATIHFATYLASSGSIRRSGLS